MMPITKSMHLIVGVLMVVDSYSTQSIHHSE